MLSGYKIVSKELYHPGALKYGFLNLNFPTTELETENFVLQVYIPAFYFFKNIFNILIISNLK